MGCGNYDMRNKVLNMAAVLNSNCLLIPLVLLSYCYQQINFTLHVDYHTSHRLQCILTVTLSLC